MRSFAFVAVFAATVAVALAATKLSWNGFHTTWSVGGAVSYGLGTGFYDMPLTTTEATKKGWELARNETYTSLWCLPDDPRVCTIFDNQGCVAGIQIGFPVEDLSGTPYDWTQHSLFSNDTIFDLNVAAGRLYFISQDVLESGGRSSVDETGTGIWMKDGDYLVNVPLNASELEPLGWTRENCIPFMGRHYYYNITNTMDCADFEPFFILVDNSKEWVRGMGFQAFGQTSKKDRNWEENVPGLAVKPTIPTAPDCLTEWADDYGVLSVHIYFTKYPYLYFC